MSLRASGGARRAGLVCTIVILGGLVTAGGARAAAAGVLLVLPGFWGAFGLPLPGVGLVPRLLLAVVLTPICLVFQFALLRGLGVPFAGAAWLLLPMNLPAAWLAWRHPVANTPPPRHTLVILGVGFLLAVMCLLPQMLSIQGRAYSGHAWWHADVMYMVANGQLMLEEPELAGVRMGYAWAGHIYQAVIAFVAGTSPLASFIWPNLLWLLTALGFVALITEALGGQWLAQLGALSWLTLGVNASGYVLWRLLETSRLPTVPGGGTALTWWRDTFAFGGDWRFTPWVMKYFFLHQMLIGLGAFAALLYLEVHQARTRKDPVSHATWVGLLLTTVGVIYPVLAPAAFAVAGVSLGVALFWPGSGKPTRAILPAAISIALAAGVTYAMVRLATRDRVTGMVSLASGSALASHAAIAGIAFLPFLLAGALVAGRREPRPPLAAVIPLVAGLSSLLLYVFVHVAGGGLEYKFVFTAALALTPFAAIGTERALHRRAVGTHWRITGLVALTALFAVPFIHKLRNDPWARTYVPGIRSAENVYPRLDLTHFDTRLPRTHPYAGLVDALRRDTPVTTMLITRDTAVHFPTLAHRPMFVAPHQERGRYPGINVPMDQMLTTMRGYDPSLLAARRAQVETLFGPGDDRQRGLALQHIMELRRPAAFILELPRDSALARWLGDGRAPRVYRDDRLAAYLFPTP